MLCRWCRIAALIALAFYLQGAAWNAPVTRGGADGECYYLRSGVFRRAGILSLVATALGIVSYILLTRRPHGMAASAGYGQGYKPDDGHYPPVAAPGVGMQHQYPAAQQGYDQWQPPYPPPVQASANPPCAAPPVAGQGNAYGGQAPANPLYAAPPVAGQGDTYENV
jgi:hypothetical protein